MLNIVYYSDGHGNWTMTQYQEQCAKPLIFAGKCQGVKGHEGDHWCYREDGSYAFMHRKNSKTKPTDIAGGWTPPGHPNYISPIDMECQLFLHFKTTTKVTDPKLIARLNKGKLKKGESLNLPNSD